MLRDYETKAPAPDTIKTVVPGAVCPPPQPPRPPGEQRPSPPSSPAPPRK